MINKELGYLKDQGHIEYTCPSNIAIVKYWGKTAIQIPVNPSISFTLKNSVTRTSIQYSYNTNQNGLDFSFHFEEKENPGFEKKLKVFFDRIIATFPWLNHYYLQIKSSNTFPHSSGIASSASSYAALAECLGDLHEQITGKKFNKEEISDIARLGSGSACRSIYGGWNTWGKSNIKNSSNHYAVNLDDSIHPNFKDIHDTILIVSDQKKSISSTAGHQMMENHPYKDGRITQANINTEQLYRVLKNGDWSQFIEITESEALSLHALMMSSSPGYTLLLPHSLQIVQQIREFREQNKIPLCFTIDAGPNIHVLYPAANKNQVQEFIQNELVKYCTTSHLIHDELGVGPMKSFNNVI